MADDRLAVVQQAYEAFVRGDISTGVSMVGPNVEWSVPRTVPQGGRFSGPAEVSTFFRGLGAAWQDLGGEGDEVGAIGSDLVVGLVHISGKLRGGADVAYRAVHVFRVEDGCIVEFRELVDLDAAIPG